MLWWPIPEMRRRRLAAMRLRHGTNRARAVELRSLQIRCGAAVPYGQCTWR